MEFEWDPTKNEANIAKHGLDFADAEALFENDVYAAKDARKDYGEERWRGIGELHGRVLVVVWTDRGPGKRRIISLRRANERERKAYRKAVEDGLGKG